MKGIPSGGAGGFRAILSIYIIYVYTFINLYLSQSIYLQDFPEDGLREGDVQLQPRGCQVREGPDQNCVRNGTNQK